MFNMIIMLTVVTNQIDNKPAQPTSAWMMLEVNKLISYNILMLQYHLPACMITLSLIPEGIYKETVLESICMNQPEQPN